ncbi:putative sit4 phosphatase-associated protein [Diaporthe ampelina]|uniref:Putative sit4 phosphatase-associated protein n=1 Tax=Diaporthe ampelina TaxID=1214573 RepID=A0A0G2FCG4_9PEZI|nr:putative sit4 phosphatase-associated protein [Diaporthe ampelina]
MFWRFGGYANISTIDTILDKSDFTLEELLDEGDLIQELKQHNAKLIDYLRDEPVLVRLLEYVVAPKLEPVATPDVDDDDEKELEDGTEKGKGRVLPFSRPRTSSRASEPENKEEEMEKKRNRYAYVAAEILASDNWSICEALLANKTMLRNFWEFLQHPIPLDPLQASYFTKVNEALFDKKTEEMIELLKSIDNAVPDMLRHVDCPMIMDLLLKIISLERTEAGQGIVEWLYTQDVMPTLLSFLGPEHSWATQTSAGDFMKAIITVSANASQNEQTCIGPNELTRQLVSKDCVEKLISYMLGGGNALTVGVGIVIEVIRKNNSDYDPDVGAEASSSPSSRDPIYLGTLLRLFAEHVPDFAHLIMNAPAQKARLDSTFGDKIEPLGFDRFKTCELMAELLHCSNMGLLNEVGSEELIAARDSERQRLRVEGKLSALRGEDVPSSADDLTMRISHSSPADEGRRLEITNISEDDGFEEVAHSKEMTEDTSHEFVKAEEEIQAGQATSFLDKDEDDFVDEPLSSPRLQVSDAKIEEPDFDDPDLVVAPLSPSKQKANDLNELPSSPSKDEGPKVEDLVEDMQKSLLEDKPKTPEPQDAAGSAEDSGASTPAVDTPAASSVAESETTKPEVQDSQPSVSEPPSSDAQTEGADKPAPLFSQPQTTTEEVAVTSAEPKEAEASDALKQAEEPKAAPEAAELDQAEHTAGDASIVVGHEVQPEAQDLSNVQPVVGDYLKMQFVEYGIVPTILSFFFKYPWNNFLHNVVYDIVQQVFNGPMDRGFNPTLAISLFESADITSQIINGQHASEQSQQQNKTRMGYMGHLTLIAEEVVKFTERHPPELLSETVLQKVMDQEWINYVEGALAETRERDNAILGGVRPEVAMSNRQAGGLSAVGLSSLGAAFGSSQGGSSNALADAGLNGGLNDVGDNGGGNGIGPFAISSGTLMSGFGSSSDEDEDEEAENEEDVNNEVGVIPFVPSQPRPRRSSGLSSFAGRPVPRLFTRSISGFHGSEDCIEDSDSDDPERSCPDLDDNHEHDSTDEDELEPRKMITQRIAPPLAGGPRRGTLADPMDDFEDVSLGDESDSNSLGHISPDEWEDVEDQGLERTDDDLAGPVQQVDDGAHEQETDVVGQADDDNDPLFRLLISVNFPSEDEMRPRRARRDEEIHEGMLQLVRELFDGKYSSTFLDRMADILSCPPCRPPSEHDMRVQACLVEIGRLVQKSASPDEATNADSQSDNLMADEEEYEMEKQL